MVDSPGPAKSAWLWLREEFGYPGAIIALGALAWCLWYGIAHRTWFGGFVFATGGAMFNRWTEASIKSWRARRRASR
jgi:hypothetical protein